MERRREKLTGKQAPRIGSREREERKQGIENNRERARARDGGKNGRVLPCACLHVFIYNITKLRQNRIKPGIGKAKEGEEKAKEVPLALHPPFSKGLLLYIESLTAAIAPTNQKVQTTKYERMKIESQSPPFLLLSCLSSFLCLSHFDFQNTCLCFTQLVTYLRTIGIYTPPALLFHVGNGGT